MCERVVQNMKKANKGHNANHRTTSTPVKAEGVKDKRIKTVVENLKDGVVA